MVLYKLTDADGRSGPRDMGRRTQWGPNVTHRTNVIRANPRLCTGDVIHAYPDPHLAALMAPVHVQWSALRMWEAEGEVVVSVSDKVGCYELTTLREIGLPHWVASSAAKRVRVRFAALAARAVLDIFEAAVPGDRLPRTAIEVVEGWLAGAPLAHYAAASGAAWAAASDAAWAAASGAAWAAASGAASAVRAVTYDAAYSAAGAATSAGYAMKDIDLVILARQAVEMEAGNG